MLEFAVVEVTDRCNLRCRHCYDHFVGRTTLGDDDFAVVLDNLAEVGCEAVTLSGGEPLLLGERLFALAGAVRERRMRPLLVTNGSLVRRHDPSRFVVFDHVQVSLDGPEAVHDAQRGSGSYASVVAAVEALRGRPRLLSVQMTLTDLNQHAFWETRAIAAALGVKMSVERVSPTGRGAERGGIDWGSYREVLEAVVRDPDLVTSDPLLNAVACEVAGVTMPAEVVAGCSAGSRGVVVTVGLEVLPCVRLREPVGSLRSTSLAELMERRGCAGLAERRVLRGRCGTCRYWNVCGGCRADAWLVSGDALAEDPFCRVETRVSTLRKEVIP